MTDFSPRHLKYMRALAETFPDREIVQQVIAQLPWGHAITLIDAIKDPAQRIWYGEQAREHGWSRNVLTHQVRSDLFGRQGKAITNFARTLPAPQSDLAQALIKDPYSFDLLGLGPDISERELERSLLDHLRSLILELALLWQKCDFWDSHVADCVIHGEPALTEAGDGRGLAGGS